jgi:hypothetical protein
MVMYMSNENHDPKPLSREELDELHGHAKAVINSIQPNKHVSTGTFTVSDIAATHDGSAFLHTSHENPKSPFKEVHARVKIGKKNYVANAYQATDPDKPLETTTTAESQDNGEYKAYIKDPRAVQLVASLAAKELRRKAEQPDNP